MRFKEKVFNILNMEIGNKHNLLDLSISLKEAGLLLKSNINTAETINLLSKTSPNKNLKKIFSEVYENLLQGHDLYNSFLKVNKFDNLFLSLIKSGESSERLSEVFLYLSLYYEKKYKLKQKLISLLTYPFILLSVTVIVLIFLLNNVIPTFLYIFEDSNIELPAITKFLVKSIDFVKYNYLYIILGILVFIILLKLISKKYKVVGAHLFTLDKMKKVTAFCRNIAPLVGIDEECATGTSNGALTHYLKDYNIISIQDINIFIQGESMGKTSTILSRYKEDKKTIQIGGNAVISFECKLYWLN